jgi:uncharacterized protein (TIGR02646 family)
MRRLVARPALNQGMIDLLADRTALIEAEADPVGAANRLYTNARQSRWFGPVIDALRGMAGPGERCMFCSGSECSQVEHFQPKAIFPTLALVWENLLWVCGICNQFKGDRFPPDTEQGERIIDPVTENVWDFFFVDEFGNLTERWRPELDSPDPRARITVEVLGLDRDALQRTRQSRLEDLKEKVTDALTLLGRGDLTVEELRARVRTWATQPFQPDVADYFLHGPGSAEEPFSELFRILDRE